MSRRARSPSDGRAVAKADDDTCGRASAEEDNAVKLGSERRPGEPGVAAHALKPDVCPERDRGRDRCEHDADEQARAPR